jgi:hypothetical protein
MCHLRSRVCPFTEARRRHEAPEFGLEPTSPVGAFHVPDVRNWPVCSRGGLEPWLLPAPALSQGWTARQYSVCRSDQTALPGPPPSHTGGISPSTDLVVREEVERACIPILPFPAKFKPNSERFASDPAKTSRFMEGIDKAIHETPVSIRVKFGGSYEAKVKAAKLDSCVRRRTHVALRAGQAALLPLQYGGAMRAILSILCLFAGLPADVVAEEFEATRLEKAERYRAILAAIAADPALSVERKPSDLPDGVREAVEAWTQD